MRLKIQRRFLAVSHEIVAALTSQLRPIEHSVSSPTSRGLIATRFWLSRVDLVAPRQFLPDHRFVIFELYRVGGYAIRRHDSHRP